MTNMINKVLYNASMFVGMCIIIPIICAMILLFLAVVFLFLLALPICALINPKILEGGKDEIDFE